MAVTPTPKLEEALSKFFHDRGYDSNDGYNLSQAVIGMLMGTDEMYSKDQVESLVSVYREEITTLRVRLTRLDKERGT